MPNKLSETQVFQDVLHHWEMLDIVKDLILAGDEAPNYRGSIMKAAARLIEDAQFGDELIDQVASIDARLSREKDIRSSRESRRR